MIKLLTVLCLMPLIASKPTISFDTIIEHSSSEDAAILEANNITNWDRYYDYLDFNSNDLNGNQRGLGGGTDNSISNKICNVDCQH